MDGGDSLALLNFFLLNTKIAGDGRTWRLSLGLLLCVQLKQRVKCQECDSDRWTPPKENRVKNDFPVWKPACPGRDGGGHVQPPGDSRQPPVRALCFKRCLSPRYEELTGRVWMFLNSSPRPPPTVTFNNSVSAENKRDGSKSHSCLAARAF